MGEGHAGSQKTPDAPGDWTHYYYERVLQRKLHEYDQRDRDFVMHVTINGGIFAALSFVVSRLNFHSPRILIFGGLATAAVAAFGFIAANALLGSVRSFKYWQELLDATLVRLELEMLPDPNFGFWCHAYRAKAAKGPILTTLVEPELAKRLEEEVRHIGAQPPNLIDHRELMAKALRVAWSGAAIAGVVLAVMGLVSMKW